MIGLRIIECGLGTSLQDIGRFGYRRFGVSTSGTMDRRSAALANALVGNVAGSAVIEFHMLGGKLLVEEGPVVIATVGPQCVLRIAGKQINKGCSARAEPGEIVEVESVRQGVFAYVAVGGGFNLNPELGSRSVHRRSGIGGPMLVSGAYLTVSAAPRQLMTISLPKPDTRPIRVVPGPQNDRFVNGAIKALCSSSYVIRSNSDRMAYCLSGPALHHLGDANIISDGVLPGSIQVPGDGQPIVLLRDCQTTGGYPKIATVISADLDRFAQISPGGLVHFLSVTLDQAIVAARAAAAEQTKILATISPAIRLPTTDTLLRLNLIDGVTDGS
ncbi:MAG: biotin-dependent carboxyltransferase family protein [Halioglobus sp.]